MKDFSSNVTGKSSVPHQSSGKMHTSAGGAKSGDMVNKNSARDNMPSANGSRPASHPSNVLGSKKHGAGNVPGYLKNK